MHWEQSYSRVERGPDHWVHIEIVDRQGAVVWERLVALDEQESALVGSIRLRDASAGVFQDVGPSPF